MWNELGGQYPFSLLCAYPARPVTCSHYLDALTEVCRTHTEVTGSPPEPELPICPTRDPSAGSSQRCPRLFCSLRVSRSSTYPSLLSSLVLDPATLRPPCTAPRSTAALTVAKIAP